MAPPRIALEHTGCERVALLVQLQIEIADRRCRSVLDRHHESLTLAPQVEVRVTPRVRAAALAGLRSSATDVFCCRKMGDLTSLNVQKACAGDVSAFEWVVARLSPPLKVAARRLLREASRRAGDEDDLLQEVWGIAFQRMGEIKPRDGRLTPVLMSYLSTALQLQAQNWLRKVKLRTPTLNVGAGGEDSTVEPSTTRSDDPVRRAMGREDVRRVEASIEALPEPSKVLFELAFSRSLTNSEIADTLGMTANAVAIAKSRLRSSLLRAHPGCFVEDFKEKSGTR